MQNWSNSGQGAGHGGQEQWQNDFDFSDQNGSFDPNQNWSQPIPDQTGAYPQQLPGDAANLFTSNQTDSFLGTQHGGHAPNQLAFDPSRQDAMSMRQTYAQTGRDTLDAGFGDVEIDLYSNQGKLDFGNGMNSISQAQADPHGQTQAFPQQNYGYQTQGEQLEQPMRHLTPTQLVQQQRQQHAGRSPSQQFQGMQTEFAQGFSRPSQPHPINQHLQSRPQQHTQQFAHSQSFSQPQVNGQQNLQFQNAHQLDYQRQPQHSPPQQAYAQPNFASQTPLAYSQQLQQPASQASQLSQSSTSVHAVPSASSPANAVLHQQINQGPDVTLSTAAAEPSPKKRKRTTKSAAEAVQLEPVASPAEVIIDLTSLDKKSGNIDDYPVPTATPADAQLVSSFAKRTKAVQASQPGMPTTKTLQALPYFASEGTLRLPAPKSYDKLSPIVALPSRSHKPIAPHLGYNLPCEVQGQFTFSYRPSADKVGLDGRRTEAQAQLHQFDELMRGLGKRRPKYTEYPHAFKEQLKSDEASKNKAGKKAKKAAEEEQDKPKRAAVRPSDPLEAAVWDLIGFVEIDDSLERTNALIAGRVQQVGDILIQLRTDYNKAKLALEQGMKDKEADSELAALRAEAEARKEALYKALDATVEHADDSVLDNLGGHQKLILSLINALITCIKAADFSSKLPSIVLELFSHFRMTKKIAETTNFESVRKRFADKGDEQIKIFVRRINAKIRKLSKPTDGETATGYTGTSAASRAKTTPKSAEVAPAKRSREDEPESRTVKKIAVESGGSALSKKLAAPKTTVPKPSASSSLLGKARPVAKSIVKPDVDTKPGSPAGSSDDKSKADTKKAAVKTENGKTAASSKSDLKPPAPVMGAAPSSSALSGIASLLDSINAPKPEPVATAVKESKEIDPAETPEERTKRLRKEARRKLRVSWKSEEELVQVKIFQKEDEEDEGRDVNMIKDAADDRSEGMVLKQRANVEEEEDDDDIPYQPWEAPLKTDFSGLSDEVRNKNYVTRGGNVEFTTDEQQRIIDREHRELMAIYTDPADIPPTPKSPSPEPADDHPEAKVGQIPGADPKFQEILLRWRDGQQMGIDGALYAAVTRMDAKLGPANKLDTIFSRLSGQRAGMASGTQQRSYASVPLAAGGNAEELLLAWLVSDKVKTWRDPHPSQPQPLDGYHYSDPETKLVGSILESVTRALANKPYPASAPPDWLCKDEERIREWWFGYNKDSTVRQRKADEERARAEADANALRARGDANANQGDAQTQAWAAWYAQQQQQTQQPPQQPAQQQQDLTPYMAIWQQMQGGQGAAQGVAAPAQASQIPDTQLQSMLAAINQPGQPPAPPQPLTAASFLGPSDASYHQAAPPADRGNDRERDRGWDRDRDRDVDRDRDWDRSQHDDYHKDNRKRKATLPPHKPANKALIGTKACTFWAQGKCARGDKCTFRHD